MIKKIIDNCIYVTAENLDEFITMFNMSGSDYLNVNKIRILCDYMEVQNGEILLEHNLLEYNQGEVGVIVISDINELGFWCDSNDYEIGVSFNPNTK